jgi:FkbM family methyltransferase
VLAAVSDPQRQVVAFDANPEALAVTARNLFLNGICQQVQFALGFVSDRPYEVLDFFAVGSGGAGSRYPSASRSKATRVRTTTLDLTCEQLGVIPELVKVDVEGAESEVLAGARGLTLEHRPAFFVEMHSPPGLSMRDNGEKVLGWCGESGYEAYYLKNHERVHSPEPFQHRGRCHLLLLPGGRDYPDYLRGIQQGESMESAAG